MKELIMIHVGQAGVQIGNCCWELLAKELKVLTTESSENIEVLFNENKNSFTSRGVFIDLDTTPINNIRKANNLHSPLNLISGKGESANHFASGHYTLGKDVIDPALDQIRHLTEQCKNLGGFIITRSSSGGTGTGIASLLAERLKLDYSKKPLFGINVAPSPNIYNEVIAPYNFLMELSCVLEHFDCDVWVDNEALYKISKDFLANETPDYYFINQLIAQSVNSIVGSHMYGIGTLNNGLESLAINLVPYPRIKLVLPTYLPLINPWEFYKKSASVANATIDAYSSVALMQSSDLTKGTFLGSTLLYRGGVNIEDAHSTMSTLTDLHYAPFIKNKYGWQIRPKNTMIDDKKPGTALSQKSPFDMLMLANNSCVSSSIKNISTKFDKLYAKRAYVHWYVGEGMSESGFMIEGRDRVEVLLDDYKEICQEEINEDEEE
eukprot:TRINITY_DN330_c0_g1_i1.p1 TRINITY_DN330_c0_g1~~TRINITY_DN330_c0_g1_i1.p1  ORF type:complete len:495 (-),score=22.84 TRINITY_DN330_c0_g1_i1:148-1458(-)